MHPASPATFVNPCLATLIGLITVAVPTAAWAEIPKSWLEEAAPRAPGSLADMNAGDLTTTNASLSLFETRLAFAQPEAASSQPAAPASEAVESSDTDLAKKLSNPIADLISIPFQFNYDEGYGPKDAGQFRLNIQPVIPFHLTEDWNLITRTIVPVIHRDSLAPGLDSDSGLGDILQSFFFSPREPIGGWILGAGPAINWPSATDNDLGSRKWGIGPTVVALRQEHGWTYGVLANHIWSFAGESDRDSINSSFVQPFLSYTFPTATSITLNTESTYDWNASEWTVPVNLLAAQIIKIGKLPVQLQLGGRYYAGSPDGGPEWGIRFGFTILLPG